MYNQIQLKDFVERAISNLSYNTEAEKLIDPVRYVLSIGGKRLRPVIALMACNLYNDKIDEAVMPAAGIEVFHNFTLVHDDIMDEAPLRRNFATVHKKWDINQAVLSGDVMAFIANDCFLQAPQRCLTKVFRTFNKAAIEVCVGQQLDMDFEKATSVSQDEYLRMIELKTAVLLAASARIGAVIGGADDKDSDLIYEFGRNLGLAFQLQDDMLDIYGNVKVFGKIPGGDIISDKKTFLLIKAMEIASKQQKKKLQEIFLKTDAEPETKVKQVVEIYDELNIKDITESLANEYINAAIECIQKLNVPEARKEEMIMLAGTLIGREK
jgi:geranylgeranyl diphosphate synthase, type II